MPDRPYIEASIDQLEALVSANRGRPAILGPIRVELEHRKTPRAKQLAKEVLALVEGDMPSPKPPKAGRPTDQASLFGPDSSATDVPNRHAAPSQKSRSNLALGRRYTRQQIHDILGGSVQEFLPHVNGAVVCGCFDPEKNPSAPQIVLPGNSSGRMRWASVFAAQRHFVPVFIKRMTDAWEYVGDYRVSRRSFDSEEIRNHAKRTGRAEISQVLHLERAS